MVCSKEKGVIRRTKQLLKLNNTVMKRKMHQAAKVTDLIKQKKICELKDRSFKIILRIKMKRMEKSEETLCEL